VDQAFHEKEENQEKQEKHVESQLDVLLIDCFVLQLRLMWLKFVFTHSNYLNNYVITI